MKRNIAFLAILMVGFTLPFSIVANSMAIIIALITACFNFSWEQFLKNVKSIHFIGFSLLYFVCLIGFFNAEDFSYALFDMEQKLSFIVLPLIFVMNPLWSSRERKYIFLSFITSVAIVCLLSFRNGFYWGYSGTDLYDNILIHHPYLAIHCVSCVFFCIFLLENNSSFKIKILYAIGVVFFIFFLTVLFAKMGLLILCVLACLYAPLYFYQRKNNIVLISLIVVLLGLFCYGAFINSEGRMIIRKVVHLEKFEWKDYDARVVNTLNIRLRIWGCVKEILEKDSYWIWGVGPGKDQQLLNNCYKEKLDIDSFFIEKNYGPHNQYLTIWMSIGLLPFLLLLFHFFVALSQHIKRRETVAILFTVGIMIFCLSESGLERQKGIVFYCFFQSLFLFSPSTVLRKSFE